MLPSLATEHEPRPDAGPTKPMAMDAIAELQSTLEKAMREMAQVSSILQNLQANVSAVKATLKWGRMSLRFMINWNKLMHASWIWKEIMSGLIRQPGSKLVNMKNLGEVCKTWKIETDV